MATLKSHNKDSPFPPLQETTLRVYSMRFCPYAQRTLLVLEHKNIPYEVVNIDLKSKPDWLLERNPMGLVPTIEKGGKIIYESTATSEWIDDVYPCPRLTPSDPFVKAEDRMYLEYFGKLTTSFYIYMRKEEERESAIAQMQKHLKFYEDALKKRVGPLFGGSSPSLLDLYIWPHFERIAVYALTEPRFGVNEGEHPALIKWYAHMYELPAVKRLLHSPETHSHYIQSSLAGKPEYDYGL